MYIIGKRKGEYIIKFSNQDINFIYTALSNYYNDCSLSLLQKFAYLFKSYGNELKRSEK